MLYQNDDFGKDYLDGLTDGLGDKAESMIVAEATFELTDPTVDSQVIQLRGQRRRRRCSSWRRRKFAAQAIRKAHDLGWKPSQIFLPVGSASVPGRAEAGRTPRGDGRDHRGQREEPGRSLVGRRSGHEGLLCMGEGMGARTQPARFLCRLGRSLTASSWPHLLRRCGDELTRENLMRQASSLKGYVTPLTLPGVTLDTGPADYLP